MVYYKSVNYQCVNMRGKIAGHCEKTVKSICSFTLFKIVISTRHSCLELVAALLSDIVRRRQIDAVPWHVKNAPTSVICPDMYTMCLIYILCFGLDALA